MATLTTLQAAEASMAGAAGLPTILCDMSSPMRERVALGISSTHEVALHRATPTVTARPIGRSRR
eukprot:2706312-Prymnesium_polylepis.2